MGKNHPGAIARRIFLFFGHMLICFRPMLRERYLCDHFSGALEARSAPRQRFELTSAGYSTCETRPTLGPDS